MKTLKFLFLGFLAAVIMMAAPPAAAKSWWLSMSAAVAAVWGTITGTLSDQSDLNTQLGLKATAANPTFTGAVTIPNGTSSAVAFKFADNSGWYRTAANQWGWTSEQGSAPTPPALEVLNAGIKVRDEANVSTLANSLSTTSSTATYTLPSGGVSHDFVGNSNSGAFVAVKNATTSRTWYMGSLGSNYVDGVKAFAIRGGDTDTFRQMIKPNGDVGFGPDFDSGFNNFTIKQGADVTGLTGTTTANASTTITGSGTLYQQEVGIGDRISLSSASSTYATVTAIASNTSLTVDTALGDGTSQTINRKRAMLSVRDSSNATKVIVKDTGAVALGTASPNASAILQADSTTKGALLPRGDETQRDAISSPATGLLFWNTVRANLEQYTGSAWQSVGAGLAGVAYFPGVNNCTWSLTSATFTDFTSDSDCGGPTVEAGLMGTWATTDADLPQWSITSLPAGKYIATVTGYVDNADANASGCITLSDGSTNSGSACHADGAANSPDGLTFNAYFSYAAAGDRTFKIQGATTSGQFNLRGGSAGVLMRTQITLVRYP